MLFHTFKDVKLIELSITAHCTKQVIKKYIFMMKKLITQKTLN